MPNKDLSIEEMARAAKKVYMKEWRARNKDKVKATQQRYWEKKFKELS